MAVKINLDTFLDKEYESSSLADLPKAPVSALAGVTESDAEHLKAARDEVANQVREFAEQLRASADWAQGHQQRR